MEELLQKYAGAYASDFEMEESDASSGASEPSTSEYEEESEEEDTSSQSDSTEEVGSESEEEVAVEEEASASQEEDFGVEYLLKQDEDCEGEGENDSAPTPGPKKEITDIAAAAESLQPKGYTLATTQVKTPIPYLLRGTLREYQHIGLDWLVTMYEKKLNGILADEMGLGKTIQTISLLAHLACEKGSWGPHLIIVPTSVMLNWEMEIKRWCPSFKILTYYGAQKERKLKRQGWTKPNAFHICITSYKLVLQDHQAFRRKNWKYLILDEAQNIKNFKSQRWQSLLNFNSQRRLLLTGTPLQNSLMELWSLMHFLMPHVFQSHREFKEWFSNPLTGMIEGSQEYNENLVKRLHKVLRPFLLRRVKVDVEKQMPKKYEHVIKCRLSKRQRYLYDDFMAQATTKETLATGHFMSVINILMQLRKVCNHPNLFDPRPIHSPFITEGICFNTASLVLHALDNDPFKHVDMGIFDLINLEGRVSRYETDTFLPKWKVTRKLIEEIAESPDPPPRPKPVKMKVNRMLQPMPKTENRTVVLVNNPRPAAPLQRPMTPILPETLTPGLAPIHHSSPILPGPVQSPTLPVSVSLPVPPSPVTMSIPVPPPARPQTPTLVPPLSQNNTAATLLHTQASAAQVLPMAMTAAQLIPNASRLSLPPTPVSPTATTTSSFKLGIVPAPVGQMQAPSTLAMSAVGQPQAPSTLTMPAIGQSQAPNALAMPAVGQLQAPNTLAVSAVGQPQTSNTLAMSAMGQPQAPNTLAMSTVGQLQGMPVVGQPQAPSTQTMSLVGQPQAVSAVGQPQALNTLAVSTMGQSQTPNTLAMSVVGQPQAVSTMGQPPVPNSLAVSGMVQPQAMSTMGQSQVPNTLTVPAVGQPQASNTLAVSAMGQPQAMSIMGQPQAPHTPAMSAVGQPQTPNPLAMSTVGQAQAPNMLDPAPAAQQSTSTMGSGTIGGMLKPMNVHSAVPALPGYNFATAGALQQRLLLSPDMQARLPSGEVVSIGQLASLANRPLQSAPGSKPLTFQIQGNKLTLTGTQVRQVTMPQPTRQLPRNVVHLLSAGGQHHIISQPAQVALIQAMAQQAGQSPVGVQAVPGHQPPTILPVPATTTAAAAVASPATISVPIAATQVPSSAVNSSGVVKIVVRQAPRDGLVSPPPGPQQPPLRPATPTTASLPGLPASLMAQRAPLSMNPVPPIRIPTQPQMPVRPSTPAPLQALVRPTLRMLQAPNPSMEQQMVSAPLPSSVAPFALSPAGTVTVSASPAMAPQTTSSPVPREEPEMLLLRSTTPTPPPPSILAPRPRRQPPPPPRSPFYLESLEDKRKKQKEERLDRLFRLNEQHCNLAPIYGTEVLQFCTLFPPAPAVWRNEEEESDEQVVAAQDIKPKGWRGASYAHCYAAQVQRDPQSLASYWQRSEALAQAILTPQQRIEQLTDIIERFIFVMPPVEAPAITMHTSHPPPSLLLQQAVFKETLRQEFSSRASCLHRIICNMRTQFPDLRLIQYDCGKLQTLDVLLRQLKAGAHRVLIFTQMTRMLDVLEQFLNYHGHIYLRLDGSTRVEQRQALMERFNADKRIFCFILSTRSGGVGVNLTGADTVVFYDSDWNPTMDAQAQDRCHRIGQTRDVHIYRLISERTVEENILKKANQKRMLGDMAIEGGNFTTAYFKQQTIRDLFDMPLDEPGKKEGEGPPPAQEEEEDPMATKQAQILEQALCRAEDPEDIRAATQAKAEQVADLAEFNENIPLDTEDRPSREEEEEMSKAEQEIASLVEQLTPIERYAMNFLEASLEDISREELKQAEEQVEAARKDIDQAKDEVVFKLPEDEDESLLTEEVSSKKSKKARVSSRTASERTGTRVSERLRSTRQMLRDGDGGDAESPQGRLPNLRHSRMAAEEEEDGLPQVAQHTRGAAIRRELVREETPAHPVLHARRTMVRREELWTKPPTTAERLQKTALYRTEAFTSSDRVLRTNPHRTDTPPAGEKVLRVTPPKPDLGAAGDRMQRGTQPTGDRLPRGAPQRADTSVDKVLRLGQQKPEKPIGLDKLQSSPSRPDVPASGAQISQLHPQGLDREAVRLKVDLREQKESEVSPVRLSSSELQASKDVPGVELAACLAQDGPAAVEKPLNIQTPAVTEKAIVEKAPGPVTPVATVELPRESKLEDAHEVGLAVEVQECLSRPEEEKGSTVKQQDSLNSVDDVPTQEAQEGTPLGSADRTVSEGAISKSSEDTPVQNTGRATPESVSEATKVEVPVLIPDQSVAAADCLPQLEILPRVKEQNGLEQPPRTGSLPLPVPNSLNEPKPKMLPPETVLPTPEPAISETGSLKESPRQEQGVVGKPLTGGELQNKEAKVPSGCTEAGAVQESPLAAAVISSGVLFSDENPSPARVPRRRTSADVLILRSGQGKDGPAAKVLRKLPGRLVTVVEEKELIRRRRNRMRRLDAASIAMLSPSNSSTQSVLEPETSPSGKELPLLRDLPARRRIELESRAAAKEKGAVREELLVNASTEPVKRKRGRPPKNKCPERQSSGLPQPSLEPALENNPQSKALEKVPEVQPPNKALEKKTPKAISAKRESLKNKLPSSKNDSPVEKRRRGRPPKVRDPPVIPPKPPASDTPPATLTKPLVTELPSKASEQTNTSIGPAPVIEATSRVNESAGLHPKPTFISKSSPKRRNRMTTHPKLASKSVPKAKELIARPPKPLSKSSTEVPEPFASPSTTQPSSEVQGLPSPPCPPPQTVLTPPSAETPPKRKRGRPPKNSPSPRVEVAQPPPSASDQETSIDNQAPAPPVRKRRRRRRKDELGPALPSVNQSSSEGEDGRPLTRLALLKREEKPESGSEGLAQPSPKHVVMEGPSSAESSTGEQPSSDTPSRSTRLRPGSLVPPLERETQRRKRRGSLAGSRVSNSSRKSPVPQAASEQEGGESESSLRSSSESSGNKSIQQPKRQCCKPGGARGRGRGQRHRGGWASRILRSAAKPSESTRSASSPIPTRKAGPASTSTSAGVPTGAPSAASSPAALLTSSLSNRGRKPKT
ncbi:helicase SRCAP isoform X2 [Heteronotia binoei]|uniref:helicase SRCAP isoform X2 n=1 Tax=Heteronotia binoei TaxID=13085 RepID=UPI00292FA909|nr:helicase SRCAP isoform X2 [Heteronotia binoei]